MNIFRTIIIALFGLIFFYIAHQLTRFNDFPFVINIAILVFIGALFACVLAMPLYFWSTNRLERKSWHDAFFEAAHFSLAYLNFLAVFVILRDLAAFILHFFYSSFTLEDLYGGDATFLVLILPFFFLIAGTLVVRVGPQLKKVTLKFTELPEGLENLRLLHITDLHVSRHLPKDFVRKLVDRAKGVQPDFVIYTGDILDDLASRHQNELNLLKEIPSKYGNYYVPGNHEYYWQIEQALTAFKSLGFHLLLNQSESFEINGAALQIAGITDPAARMFQLEAPDLEKIKTGLSEDAFKILLAHQPQIAPEAAKTGFDLQLSGHTHGGQFFPWNFLIGFFQKYAKGLYYVSGLQVYVNQGTGYWGPSLRLGTFCELTEIVLTKI